MSALWVVVPAHQEAARIDATLDALAAQRDRDFTLIVVDNASTDGTARDRPRLRPLGALPGPRPQRTGEGGGLHGGHGPPVRDRARGDAAGPHRRRLPAAPRPDGRCPRCPAARRGPGVRRRRRAPRRARSAGTGRLPRPGPRGRVLRADTPGPPPPPRLPHPVRDAHRQQHGRHRRAVRSRRRHAPPPLPHRPVPPPATVRGGRTAWPGQDGRLGPGLRREGLNRRPGTSCRGRTGVPPFPTV
ncbi:glycosyltransferase family A protein [Streptomyces achromogenes]|uniref:glycosyltransferase family 2 protein n=1 Tax=Streptomyces achromogenes TaxID=67255 RepID=UPI0033F6FED6